MLGVFHLSPNSIQNLYLKWGSHCLAPITCWRFSRVRLFVTPWTVAHQAPLSV